jgi:CBS domain-containing protein
MHEAPIVGSYNWMRVVDVMTEEPLTVTPTDRVGHAATLMADHGVRQLPVVRGRELVGVVTDRDIRSILGDGLGVDRAGSTAALEIPIERIMSDAPVTLSPNDDLKTAVAALIEDKYGGFPVVDNATGLIGIVTYVDLLRCFLNRLQES